MEFHLFQTKALGFFLPTFFQRNGIVEYAVVNHQQHGRVCGSLRRSNALRRVISFYMVHVAIESLGGIGRGGREEGNAAVEESSRLGHIFF